LSSLALAACLVTATCSSGTPVGFDPGMCARLSACDTVPGLPPTGASFGEFCTEVWQAVQTAAGSLGPGWPSWPGPGGSSTSGLGTRERVQAALIDCVVRAPDCAAVQACIQATPAQAAVCNGFDGVACSGDAVVACSGLQFGPAVTDCAAAGTSCIPSGLAQCGTAPCTPGTAPSCDGDLLVTCNVGTLQSSSCALFVDTNCVQNSDFPPPPGAPECTTQVGNTCGAVNGTAQCVGDGPPCDGPLQSACDGTVIVSCTGGRVAHHDCAALGLTCVAGNLGATCAGTGTQCTGGTPESCDGSVLTYCWFGNIATVDCKQYGLSGCMPIFNGEHWARCTE
jgi:hypothetical protein